MLCIVLYLFFFHLLDFGSLSILVHGEFLHSIVEPPRISLYEGLRYLTSRLFIEFALFPLLSFHTSYLPDPYGQILRGNGCPLTPDFAFGSVVLGGGYGSARISQE